MNDLHFRNQKIELISKIKEAAWDCLVNLNENRMLLADCMGYFSGIMTSAKILGIVTPKQFEELHEKIRFLDIENADEEFYSDFVKLLNKYTDYKNL